MKRALLSTLCLLSSCSSEARLFSSEPQTDAAIVTPQDSGARDASSSEDDAAIVPDGAMPPSPSRIAFTGGFDHVCAIRDGKLSCWGDGTDGKLGVGDEAARNTPTRVDARTDWVSVCAGETHTCALRNDKSAHCWGKNLKGELGLGDFSARNRPTPVPNVNFVRIACGGRNTCAITADQRLFCWGENFEGKLGQSDPFDAPDIPTPTAVMNKDQFSEVSVGQGHVCAINVAGALFCWGRNTDGQLGIDSLDAQVRTPTRVGMRSYRHVAAGQRHSCAIDVEGSLFCWGTDTQGSLGINMPDTTNRSPTAVSAGATFSEVSVMWFHTCAVRTPSELYCWGRNDEGQLGLGDIEARAVPTRVGFDMNWARASNGHFHTCATRDAELYCWGENAVGQLGLDDSMRRNTPVRVNLP